MNRLRALSPLGRLVVTGVAALAVLAVVGSLGSSGAGTGPSAATGAGATTSPLAGSLGPSEAIILASVPPLGTAPAAGSPPTASAPKPTATARPRATRTPAATAPACRSTGQDAYVYHPARLEVLRACVRVTGTVDAVREEADGDLHILLRLDAPYRGLLRPSNQGEELGDLVVEPVCVRTVTQADAVGVCAADTHPLAGPFPAVGEHVWMEGRYVLDLDHGGWAELHPLYRWGPA